MTVHSDVQAALKSGRLVRPGECEECGTEGKVQGHHDDYAKPLDVRWLCLSCHRRWHLANGPGRNQTEAYVSLRLSLELDEKVKKAAAANRRSAHAQIVRWIEEGIRRGK